jgi:NCAIR mutase (PurE)-related protein
MPDWDLTPDDRRRERLKFDEAIYCAGKNVDQITRIIQRARDAEQSLLLTRMGEAQLDALPEELRSHIDHDPISATGIYGTTPSPSSDAKVALVSAGSSDVGVAREAARTLAYYGEDCREFHDVGVAGLWRVLERVDAIRELPVVIVVAGMDGALPSVVAGLVPGLVIAVPTSAGYGVAAEGRTALRAALASCAPGLVVVNIDNGYGAACAALRMLNTLR